MAQDANRGQVTQLALLAPEAQALIEQTLDDVFDADQQEWLPLIEYHLQTLDPRTAGTAFETLKLALQSLWHYFSALKLAQTEGDFAGALHSLKVATEGFKQIGHDELRDLSIGLSTYCTGVVSLQSRNWGKALELLKEAKEYLQQAGEFGSFFQIIIDGMKSEALFLAAGNAISASDYATAGALTNQAALAAEQMARTYFEEGDPPYYLFQGLAWFYKACYTFSLAWNSFNRFEYDKLAAEPDLAREAVRAYQFLDQIALQHTQARNVSRLSHGYAQLLEYVVELSTLMFRVFGSTFKSDLHTLKSLRQKIRRARDSLYEAGPGAVGMLRFCDQLSNQIDNLEKLAKPNRKDFGVYSGLVSCALFLPLFLAVAWANASFGIKLEPYALITSCLIIALIGGFGFGALKFKSLILPSSSAKGAKDA